jgi:hypothetical protein
LQRLFVCQTPDVVLQGDVLETYRILDKEKLNRFIEILKDIKPEYGIYAVKETMIIRNGRKN